MTPNFCHRKPCPTNCLPWKYKDCTIISVLIISISLIFYVLLSTATQIEFQETKRFNHADCFSDSKYAFRFVNYNTESHNVAYQALQLKSANHHLIFFKKS